MIPGSTPRKFYVSYRRAENMLARTLGSKMLDDPSSGMSAKECLKIWEQARRKTIDEALRSNYYVGLLSLSIWRQAAAFGDAPLEDCLIRYITTTVIMPQSSYNATS
jgi:hypothetical protein